MSADPVGESNGAGRRTPRWIWVLLVCSLALNLLVVGLFAGSWWKHRGPDGGRYHVFTGAIERLMEDLPEAKRNHAAELVARYRESEKPLRNDRREARRAAKDAILTEPYDEQTVAAALARFREIRSGQHESMHMMMQGLLKELTLEERKKLLDYIRAGFRQRWRGRKPKPDNSSSRQ